MNQDELHTHLESIKDWDDHKSSPWVIILVAILLSIPLGLCCYLLLL